MIFQDYKRTFSALLRHIFTNTRAAQRFVPSNAGDMEPVYKMCIINDMTLVL